MVARETVFSNVRHDTECRNNIHDASNQKPNPGTVTAIEMIRPSFHFEAFLHRTQSGKLSPYSVQGFEKCVWA